VPEQFSVVDRFVNFSTDFEKIMLLIRKRSSIWGVMCKFSGFFMFLGVEIHSFGLNKTVLNGTFDVLQNFIVISGRIV
jgi:hypothetical protein